MYQNLVHYNFMAIPLVISNIFRTFADDIEQSALPPEVKGRRLRNVKLQTVKG